MARIQISKPHRLGRQALRGRVENLAEKFADDLAAEYSWQGDRLEFRRSGVRGFIAVHEDSLEVDVSLGLLLAPLKSQIESRIETCLEDALD